MERYMRNNRNGFSLIEVLIAIAVLGVIMAMNSQLLTDIIRGTARQNAIAGAQFETTLGLEMMRTDIENAGFGLPDDSPVVYNEASVAPANLPIFNDAGAVPRALAHSNDTGNAVSAFGYVPSSDYLVIKSPAVGMNNTSGRWAYIGSGGTVKRWNTTDPNNDLDMVAGVDRMIVIRPRGKAGELAQLVVSGADFTLNYATTLSATSLFVPQVAGDIYMAYGMDGRAADGLLRMPFNRADYAVRTNANTRCAPNTGSLEKMTINQSNGGLTSSPLIDCVANMQVTFRLDRNSDGFPEDPTVESLAGLTALLIKQQVKEVRVYILAHEGPMDRGFTYNGANPIHLGDAGLGEDIDLSASFGADWDHHRWKIYTLIVKPRGLY
jgi:prepilin-type N-terminal cleavage/methylation domain-containing protein